MEGISIMKRSFLSYLLPFILLFCLFLSGCGGADQPADSSLQPNALSHPADSSLQPDISSQPADSSPQPDISGQRPGAVPTIPPVLQSANDALDASDENVIVLGFVTRNKEEALMEAAARFNEEQAKYKVKLVTYGYDDFMINIMRGKGPDIFSMRGLSAEVLAKNGLMEDLASYFASSDVVRQEDIINSIWEAGSVGGKMLCLIPSFYFEGIVVEKGHADNGGWTVTDYLALAEKYPEGKITQNIEDPRNLFLNDLRVAPEYCIDWETGTCSFDSGEFIDFLEKLKAYSKKIYEISPSGTLAERLYKREYLTMRTQIMSGQTSSNYKQLKALLGDEFELAGFPGLSGEPYYPMLYTYSLGMNASSAKKEGAWAFMEFLCSVPVQEDYAKAYFPARQDVLDQALQELVDFEPEETGKSHTYNRFTQELEEGFTPFTEEDRQIILGMLGNVKRAGVMSSNDVTYIILDELELFFDGSKTAKETAVLIQNRVQLYLDEQG